MRTRSALSGRDRSRYRGGCQEVLHGNAAVSGGPLRIFQYRMRQMRTQNSCHDGRTAGRSALRQACMQSNDMNRERATMSDLRLFFFECPECQYDSVEANRLTLRSTGVCPVCAADTGHDVELKFRPATPAEQKSIKLLGLKK